MTTVTDYSFTLKYKDKGASKLYLESPFALEMIATIGDAKTYHFALKYKLEAQLSERFIFRFPYLNKSLDSYYVFKAPYLNNSKPVPLKFDFVFEFKSYNVHPFIYEFFAPYKAAITNPIHTYGIYDTPYNTEYSFRLKNGIALYARSIEDYSFNFEYDYVETGTYIYNLPYKNLTGWNSPLISYEITADSIKIILNRDTLDTDFDIVIDNGNKYLKYRHSIPHLLFETNEFVDSKWTSSQIELTIKKIDIESTFSLSFLNADGTLIFDKIQSFVIPAEPILMDSALANHRVVTLPGSTIRARFALPDTCCLSKKINILSDKSRSVCSMPDIEDKFVVPESPTEYYETEYTVNVEYGNNGFTPGVEYFVNIQYQFPTLSVPSLMIFNGNNLMISTDFGETWQTQESYDNMMRQSMADLEGQNAVITEDDIFSYPQIITQEIVEPPFYYELE